MIKKAILAVVVGGIVMSASACNTVRGAGKDVKSAGTAIEKAP